MDGVKITPGDWHVGVQLTKHGWPAFTLREMSNPDPDGPETQADRALIEAAPKLLETCKRLVEHITDTGAVGQYEQARAVDVIELATGASHSLSRYGQLLREIEELVGMSHAQLVTRVNDPKWGEAHKVHDWRNYVPSGFRHLWKDLSDETRIAIIAIAERQANAEEWD